MFAQVALKLTGPMDHLRLVWQAGETLLDGVEFDSDPEGNRYNVLLALQEMVTNVLRHGYRLDASRPIEVVFELAEDRLQIELRDQGPEFDPLAHDLCADAVGDAAGDEESMPVAAGGFGIRIARVVMDEVSYERDRGWNRLRMTKFIRAVVRT